MKREKRPSAGTIVIWAFVVIEAIGIGWFLATFSSRAN
jgi:hypothetical protein